MIKKLFFIFVLAFLANWLWENLHSFLYASYRGKPITEFVLTRAALFDAVFILFLGIIFIKFGYFRNRSWYALIFGFIVSILIELYALHTGRWAYNDLMPVIPVLGIGLTPAVQLGILSFLIFKIVGIKKMNNNPSS